VGNHPHFSKFVDIDQLDSSSLVGHLIGWTDGTSTMYDLTDARGSLLTSFSASAIQALQKAESLWEQDLLQVLCFLWGLVLSLFRRTLTRARFLSQGFVCGRRVM
jgi:hypothetical protein